MDPASERAIREGRTFRRYMPLFGVLSLISFVALLALAGVLIALGRPGDALAAVGIPLVILAPLGIAVWWTRERRTSNSGMP